MVFLQDFERVVAGNWNAGLLCDEGAPGQYKTRVCSRWLEDRGFETRIIERPFNEMTKRAGEDPYVSLCGFDNLRSRSMLEGAGFDLVVECGLGGDTDNFDDILLHTFPDASEKARALEGKAISSSFVGAYASALAVGEVLRGLHGGVRIELIHAHLRSNDAPGVVVLNEVYQNRFARSGYVDLGRG
jgi:hypothetical protein